MAQSRPTLICARSNPVPSLSQSYATAARLKEEKAKAGAWYGYDHDGIEGHVELLRNALLAHRDQIDVPASTNPEELMLEEHATFARVDGWMAALVGRPTF